jgi:hypothetical protein
MTLKKKDLLEVGCSGICLIDRLLRDRSRTPSSSRKRGEHLLNEETKFFGWAAD